MQKIQKRNKREYRSKIDPGMMFYAQKKCNICQKLIVGSSPKSCRAANSDLGQRLKAHSEEHEKEKKGKQLNLSISGREEKQTQTIRRVTLRGEVK